METRQRWHNQISCSEPKYLRELLPGKWQKVIKKGNVGEIHYFEHESGQVAGVKFFEN